MVDGLWKFKSQSVRKTDDSAMILSVMLKNPDGGHLVVRREACRRIQERFRDEGIEFFTRNADGDGCPFCCVVMLRRKAWMEISLIFLAIKLGLLYLIYTSLSEFGYFVFVRLFNTRP